MTHNAAAWNRARLVEAKRSCFSWCIIIPTGKFPKRPWEESIVYQPSKYLEVFCLTKTGKEQYIRRELPTLYFEFNWKNTLFAKRVGTNIGRATAKTYNGDRHFHNVRYR